MRRVQKMLTTILLASVLLATVSVMGAALWHHGDVRTTNEYLPVLGNVPVFRFRDQDDEPVTLHSLRGSPWIADFIFTGCAGSCPMMSAKMAAMQSGLPLEVKLVSFSLDPEHDTPAVLKKYAHSFSADESRWKFLTGNQDAIMAHARGMLVTAVPAMGDQPIIHDGRFLLVDAQGRIRGAYRSEDPQELANLERDARRLIAAHVR